ncbi:hypothetical protein MP228_002345 [Amoeboaphelidium protococcarum]|nr:hypothetical protein MP228_002345 [Amoeboaphelidium protococcarum]
MKGQIEVISLLSSENEEDVNVHENIYSQQVKESSQVEVEFDFTQDSDIVPLNDMDCIDIVQSDYAFNENNYDPLNDDEDDNDNDLPTFEDIASNANNAATLFSFSQSMAEERPHFSFESASQPQPLSNARSNFSQSTAGFDSAIHNSKQVKRSRNNAGDKEALAQEKLLKKLEAQRAKEEQKRLKQEEKQRLKQAKEQEKAIAKANAITIDKNKNVQEMSLLIDSRTPVDKLEEIRVQMEAVGASINVVNNSYSRTILWERESRRVWDQQAGLFNPIDTPYIHKEPFVAYLMDGCNLAQLIGGGQLAVTIESIKSSFPNKKLILIVYDIEQHFRKQKVELQRAFKTGQQLQLNNGLNVKKFEIENALLMLEISSDVRVINVYKGENVSEWILTLTREIASGPDVLVKTFAVDENICTDDIGGSGKDLTDTWLRMLLQVFKITPPVAQAIVRQYPTVSSFRRTIGGIKSARQAEVVLGDMVVERTIDPSNPQLRRLGPSSASRLWTMFTSNDSSMQFR